MITRLSICIAHVEVMSLSFMEVELHKENCGGRLLLCGAVAREDGVISLSLYVIM